MSFTLVPKMCNLYGIMTEELVIREIRIDEAAGYSDSQMTSFEIIMPLKNSNHFESPIVRRIVYSRLVILETNDMFR